MVCDFFHPAVGGVENHIFMLSVELIRRGHKVSICISLWDITNSCVGSHNLTFTPKESRRREMDSATHQNILYSTSHYRVQRNIAGFFDLLTVLASDIIAGEDTTPTWTCQSLSYGSRRNSSLSSDGCSDSFHWSQPLWLWRRNWHLDKQATRSCTSKCRCHNMRFLYRVKMPSYM